MPQHKGGRKGDRKFGRNKVKCENYRKYRSVRNKFHKLNRHLTVHVNDKVALEARCRASTN